MEKLFLSIQKRLTQECEELSLIDMDWGQLETEAETYPVTFPCALIDISSVVWQSGQNGYQSGMASVSVKVAVDVLDDTHQGSGTEHKVIENFAIARAVNKALHSFGGHIYTVDGVKVDVNFSRLQRKYTRSENRPGGIKVFIHDYQCSLMDSDGVKIGVEVLADPELDASME